jgi:hypothetical protein
MAEHEAGHGQTPVEDLVRLFGTKWEGFWKWLDKIGRNATPVPRRASRQAVTNQMGAYPRR